MSFKIGDRVYYISLIEENKKEFGTITKIDYQYTELPIQTVWALWDDDEGREDWMPSDEIFLVKPSESTSHWQKIIDALKAAIDKALENCEYESAIKFGKLFDEVKENAEH